ncbi:MAG: hypothetical protein AAGN82_23185 [Myxococcota bacterium]
MGLGRLSGAARVRLASLSCAFSFFLVGPHLFQGCFLRCPADPRRAELAPRLEQTYRLTHETGSLEVEIDGVFFRPTGMAQPPGPVSWVRPAEAMPSCPQIGPGTRYSLSAELTATWRPTDGDEVELADDIPIHNQGKTAVDPTYLSLRNRFVADQGPTSKASWALELEMRDGRFILKRLSLEGDTPWHVRGQGSEIVALETPSPQG